MERKRKTEKDYHELAESREFRWIGPFPKNTHTLTWWECEKGDRWEATYHNINAGYGCSFCSGKAKKTKENYNNLAKSCGFKWVATDPPKNTHTKTLWECEKGHKWLAKYNGINNGSGCPYCAGLAKKTVRDYYNLADSKSLKWVGKVLPKNNHTKTLWECKKGHMWAAQYSDIDNGHGCPFCYGNAPKIEKDYHDLAESLGFVWVGKESPKNIQTKTKWKCSNGHTFEAKYNSIQQLFGCPHCRDMVNGVQVSKQQRDLNNILGGTLNHPEGKYRIDVAIIRNNQKVAIEYDCWYWHKGNENHDAERDNYLISYGWKILHIKSGRMVPKQKQLSIVIDYLLDTNNVVYNLYLEDWKN